MRNAILAAAALAGCGGGGRVTIATSFTVATLGGHGPSPFDVLQGRTIDVRVELDPPAVSHSMTAAGADVCRTTQVSDANAARVASGESADFVQPMVLDPLPEWALGLTTCVSPGGAYRSSLAISAVIDELNLRFDCADVPQTVSAHDANGYPLIVSFTAASCTAEILDVVNNRSLGADGFTVAVDAGGGHVP